MPEKPRRECTRRAVFVVVGLLILIFAAACSESDSGEAAEEIESRESEITFGTARDVDQARGQWRHAEATDDKVIRTQLLQTALASRGTAYIEAERLDPFSDPPCEFEERIPAAGSGTLSSSTRLATARHTFGSVPFEENFEAYFETSFYPTGTPDGRFVRDADPAGTPFGSYPRNYSYTTKYNTNETNPLFIAGDVRRE